ncbi:MAG: acetyl-CoA carboxylase, carboxyltransferase subunit beta [Acidobacteriota bacterium]
MTNLWTKCNNCRKILYRKEIEENLYVCPNCNFHYRITAVQRAKFLLDDRDFMRLDEEIFPADPLNFKDNKEYKQRLEESRIKLSLNEALINFSGKIDGIPVILSVFEYSFIGGSMGSVVGEKFTRAIERALNNKIPLISVSSSGGARMQEGILSLMQMAKISAMLARLDEERIPYISVLTDPTTGGVTASLAMLGDLNIAEPDALIGFAGPRVIEQTIKEKLPKGFQSSEFLLQHGMLDDVVPRKYLREYLIRVLRLLLNKHH